MVGAVRDGGPKLIGGSPGRTGTQSLAAALERLGVECYGMRQVLTLPGHAEIWHCALTGEELAEWEKLLTGYGATIGWPMCFFAEELAQAFPGARVLMMGREAEAWYQSVANSWTVLSHLRRFRFVKRVREALSVIEPIMERIGGTPPERERAIAAYEAHNQKIRRVVPPGRIMEYEVEQGWGPLCEALEVEIPAEDFPRTNVAGEGLKDMVARLIRGQEGSRRAK